MKRENIYVGMRVKVKKSSLVTSAVGQYATVTDEPYDGYEGVYVHCIIDGDDDVYVFEICNIKISDEKPVVGDRVVVIGGDSIFYESGASGVIIDVDFDGDYLVKFDSGSYCKDCGASWFVPDDDFEVVTGTNHERCAYAGSLGEILSLKSKVKVLEQKLQAIGAVLKGDVK